MLDIRNSEFGAGRAATIIVEYTETINTFAEKATAMGVTLVRDWRFQCAKALRDRLDLEFKSRHAAVFSTAREEITFDAFDTAICKNVVYEFDDLLPSLQRKFLIDPVDVVLISFIERTLKDIINKFPYVPLGEVILNERCFVLITGEQYLKWVQRSNFAYQ